MDSISPIATVSILTQQMFNSIYKTTYHQELNNGNIVTKTQEFPLYDDKGKVYIVTESNEIGRA